MTKNNPTPRFPTSPLRTGLLCLLLVLGGCASNYAPAAAPGSAAANQSMKERQRIAGEMFRERCKKSGVFIHRTVEDVEGIFVMKMRPDKINFGDQYLLDDPYGSDVTGMGYIELFLKDYYDAWLKISPGNEKTPTDRKGYAYVEAVNPADGVRYRYTGSAVEPWQTDKSYLKGYMKFVLEKSPAHGPLPRYAVTYDDISTKEERDYWIAGSSLKVVDLQTDEVIAERIGYMVDWAQGIRLGGRSPWLLAANNACPEFAPQRGATVQLTQTVRFVNKSLKPKGAK
ncbi:hypothetical protein SAMN05192589_1492 [Paracidovorax valerianellae]|uniref:Lipoprotein n=1 Tax=Paracidovorax valerianellae TaxID=187868 RepID=A0A1G7FUM4_9BURK|nr:hypothetical protein [Paracidovorax valerianellae]SDE79576.1 hypothetical protein SAMN05192589_1492 [Paracidovorax valerianellae]